MSAPSAPTGRVPIPGSHRDPVPGSTPLDPVHPDERIEVTVVVRPEVPLPPAGSPIQEDRVAFAFSHAPAPDHYDAATTFAELHGLTVDANAAPNHLLFTGRSADLEQAFGVTLLHHTHPDGGTYRTHDGPISVPDHLDGVITGVFGLDDRPIAKPHYRRHPWVQQSSPASPDVGPDGMPAGTFTPPELAKLYDFPANVNGHGQCIAIIELGGGYSVPDLRTYFASLHIPMPHATAVSVDHGKNRPTHNPDGPDGEVMLDIEVAGAIAPGAKIIVYFAPNTDKGFLDAVTTAIHDTVNKPNVISISWGGPESSWSGQSLQAFDQAFQAAAALGITVTVASGDNGSTDGATDGKNHVDFPASSPHVLACGGTSLVANGTTIVSEVVWNDGENGGATGGGFSDVFPRPSYQGGDAPGLTRGVPDVAAVADPATGYVVRVDGESTVIGGTSAVAPLMAGLVALLNQSLGKPVGYLNPLLYKHREAFRDIVSGNNGAYAAAPGWDCVTGLGSPNGAKLLAALKA